MNPSSDLQNSYPPSSGPERSRTRRRLVEYAQHERPAVRPLEEFSEATPQPYRHVPDYSQVSGHRNRDYHSHSPSPEYEGVGRDHRPRAGDVRSGSGAPVFGTASIELALRNAGIEDAATKSTFRSVCQVRLVFSEVLCSGQVTNQLRNRVAVITSSFTYLPQPARSPSSRISCRSGWMPCRRLCST
jgi:hypothetical protein